MVQNDKSRPRELAGFYSLPPLRGLLHEHFSGRPHKPNRPHVWLTPSARVCTRTSSTKKCRRQLERTASSSVWRSAPSLPGEVRQDVAFPVRDGPGWRLSSCGDAVAGPSGGGRWRRGQAPFRGDTRREARAHAGSRAGPRGAARGREARCRRSWYRWARSLNQTGGAEGPRERTFAAQVRPFPRRRCSCQCSEAQRGAAPRVA